LAMPQRKNRLHTRANGTRYWLRVDVVLLITGGFRLKDKDMNFFRNWLAWSRLRQKSGPICHTKRVFGELPKKGLSMSKNKLFWYIQRADQPGAQ
jgi:hypothetical protein